ncbi:hypothetical protein CsSME_00030124 [Camellia sinensis var. sinensis]
MWCYCRMTYMPMSYLYWRKYHGPITDLVKSLRQEIHPKPYEEIDWSKARHDCCKEDMYYEHTFIQDLLWDTLHYLSEPIMNCWPFNKIRDRALRETVKYLCYEAENSRYITIGCVEKVLQMMCRWAENPDGDEFKHHLTQIKENPPGDFESMYRYFSKGHGLSLINIKDGWCQIAQLNH